MTFLKKVKEICATLPNVKSTSIVSIHGSSLDGATWKVNGNKFAKYYSQSERLLVAVQDEATHSIIGKPVARKKTKTDLAQALNTLGAKKFASEKSGWPHWAYLHDGLETDELRSLIEQSYQIVRGLPAKTKPSDDPLEDLI